MSTWLAGLALAIAAAAQDPPLGQSGALAYTDGQFEAARAIYERTLADPTAARGPLAYNLGNCAYRLGRHADAVLWYRRALPHLPRDAELRFNLTLAEQHLGVDNAPTSPTAMAWAIADTCTVGELLALTASLQTLGLAMCLLRRRSWAGRPLGAALIVLGLLAATPLAVETVGGRAPGAVVLTPTADLRASPDETAPVTARLGAGELVDVVAETADWLQVEHRRGRGFVRAAAVGVIDGRARALPR